MSDVKIPRIIHYCAFGGGRVDDAIMASWVRFCPDYEIRCWNEENFDVGCCDYTREAYECGRFAFVSDVARLRALEKFGGIYLDTDVELVKGLDAFLENRVFLGLEAQGRVGTAVIGAAAGERVISELLASYDGVHFVNAEGEQDLTTNVDRLAGRLQDADVTIYPQEYFYPLDYATGHLAVTSNTHGIHYFKGSWKSDEEACRDRLFFRYRYRGKLPEKLAWNLASFESVMKHRGVVQGTRDMLKLLAGRTRAGGKRRG